jgi:hypothetical protein
MSSWRFQVERTVDGSRYRWRLANPSNTYVYESLTKYPTAAAAERAARLAREQIARAEITPPEGR